jgi:hypothetical protein
MPLYLPEACKQLPNESGRWYARFQAFSMLPASERTVKAAYDVLVSNRAKAAPANWYEASRRYRWRERAAKLDEIRFSAEFNRSV